MLMETAKLTKKTVRVWTFICPICNLTQPLIGLGYFAEDSAPDRPRLGPTDSMPYGCGRHALNIHGRHLFLSECQIDQDEPLWATRMLLEKAGELASGAEALRNEAGSRREGSALSAVLIEIADIYDQNASEAIRIARSGTGKQKLEVLYGEVPENFGSCGKFPAGIQ